MADLLDQIAKQKAQLLKEQRDKEQAENRERQRKLKLARSMEALRTRQAILIGETIRDTDLTTAELAAIGGILARRSTKPKDWRVITEWLLPTEEPANDQGVETDAVALAEANPPELHQTGS